MKRIVHLSVDFEVTEPDTDDRYEVTGLLSSVYMGHTGNVHIEPSNNQEGRIAKIVSIQTRVMEAK